MLHMFVTMFISVSIIMNQHALPNQLKHKFKCRCISSDAGMRKRLRHSFTSNFRRQTDKKRRLALLQIYSNLYWLCLIKKKKNKKTFVFASEGGHIKHRLLFINKCIYLMFGYLETDWYGLFHGWRWISKESWIIVLPFILSVFLSQWRDRRINIDGQWKLCIVL